MWGRNINRLPLVCTPIWERIHNLGMCPVWEENLWPFSLPGNAPTNWASHTVYGCLWLFKVVVKNVILNEVVLGKESTQLQFTVNKWWNSDLSPLNMFSECTVKSLGIATFMAFYKDWIASCWHMISTVKC